MSNVKEAIYFTLILMVLANCSTLPNQKSEDNTLLVGELRIINRNSQIHYLPENITSEIKITFRSIDTNSIIEVNSLEGGLFLTNEITEGIYEIISFNIEFINHYVEGSRYNIYIDQEINLRYFTVIKNKINNIGLMIWTIEDEVKYVQYSGEYDSVRSKFFDGQYIQNERDTREWIVRDFLIYYYRNIQDDTWRYIVNGNDSSRYQELWIFWHLIAEEQVGNYPLPYRNETAKDWVIRNSYLVPSTAPITVIYFREVDNIEDAGIRMDENSCGLKRRDLLNDNINSSSRILFSYRGINGEDFGSVLILFLRPN